MTTWRFFCAVGLAALSVSCEIGQAPDVGIGDGSPVECVSGFGCEGPFALCATVDNSCDGELTGSFCGGAEVVGCVCLVGPNYLLPNRENGEKYSSCLDPPYDSGIPDAAGDAGGAD